MSIKINEKDSRIKGLRIALASPEKIKSWSYGEITKSETINYKSLKPEKNGLFNEVVFGPVRDYECSCGKYKKVKHRGKVCEKCEVEITESIVRRERMGHIELACPVVHIWMTKELPRPSKISLLLDISYKQVEQVVYFVNYIVLDEGVYANDENKIFTKKEIVDLANEKKARMSRIKLRKVLGDIHKELKENGAPSIEIKKARIYRERLRDSNLPFSIDEIFKFITKYKKIRFGVGAEAIDILLKEIDLDWEYKNILINLKKYNVTTDVNAKKLLRRLEVIKWIKNSGNKPEWMVLKVISVTPPDTRPIIQLDGGRFTTSDINNLYRKIIIRNERLKKIINLNAPTIILNNEKRMLQESVDALFDNNSRKKPVVGKDKRALKSLSNFLKGKQGIFRQNLLGKRVDYSGRTVIVVGPELKMYEVGIPIAMIVKLFRPFIIHELIKKDPEQLTEEFSNQLAPNIKAAEEMINTLDDKIWPIIKKVIKERPVILNRAPTLHRLGIQAFEPKMIEGKAIRLHPLVTTAFNADFDGDQMAVHVPLGREAIAEARSILLASWHILGPKDGKPIITPTQDMVLGNYYLSIESHEKGEQGIIFSSIDEAKIALMNKIVHEHTIVGISTKFFPEKNFGKNGILITTVGKLILNELMPASFPYINNNQISPVDEDVVETGKDVRLAMKNREVKKPFTKKMLSEIVNILYKQFPIEIVPETMDKIKSLSFYYSTVSGITISFFDIPDYNKKYQYFDKVDQEVLQLKRQFKKGLLTDDERYKQVVDLWSNVKKDVTDDIKEIVQSKEYQDNSIVIMSESGARGNISNFTQLAGMRGLMSRSYNYDQKKKSRIVRDSIEVPIKHSFVEGLTISEFFNSSYGARKGMTDTAMKTAKSGYMTRKLVDATQDVIVKNYDCETKYGVILSDLINEKENSIIEVLAERILNRFCLGDIIDKDGNIILKSGELITEAVVAQISAANIGAVEVRTPIHCNNMYGICQKCFGYDLSTNKLVDQGTAIGIIAAQSIGEPGTQLTMRTFHTGGVAGGASITQGFERLKQLFDCISPKPWETSIISEIKGVVIELPKDENSYNLIIKNDLEEVKYPIGYDQNVVVKENTEIEIGQPLTDGLINLRELLKLAGVDAVRQYILKEVQKVYRLQGIEISDKYIEIIIKQLTNKLQIINPEDSDYFAGETVQFNEFKVVCQQLLENGKVPPIAVNQVFGLDDTSTKSNSFLSAASFQDTKKILTDSAVKGEIDHLYGIKENVILGNLIPAGNGLKTRIEIRQLGKKMYELEY